jgi:hypothetical protein
MSVPWCTWQNTGIGQSGELAGGLGGVSGVCLLQLLCHSTHSTPPTHSTHPLTPPPPSPCTQAIAAAHPDQFRLDYALSREQKNTKGGKMYIQDKVGRGLGEHHHHHHHHHHQQQQGYGPVSLYDGHLRLCSRSAVLVLASMIPGRPAACPFVCACELCSRTRLVPTCHLATNLHHPAALVADPSVPPCASLCASPPPPRPPHPLTRITPPPPPRWRSMRTRCLTC